jgi:hypothetical protein
MREIDSFREKGFIKLRSLFTQDCIFSLKRTALQRVISASDINTNYGNTFRRLSHDLGETEIVRKIYSSLPFRKAIGSLTETRLIVTEAQSFELSKKKTGFPWHYDSVSFRYIRPQDPGYSVWIPLDTVDAKRRGGGMAYVPENIFSGKSNIHLSSLLSRKLVKGESISEIADPLQKIFSTPSLLTEMLEEHKEEDDFLLGDAFVFTRSVWHRSSPLLENGADSRLAVTIRLLDWRSRLDRMMFEGETESGGGVGMGMDWGKPKQTSYGSQFTDIAHGDEIRESRFCGPII